MKKYVAVICVVMICLLVLSGCERIRLPDLPNDAIAFEAGSLIDNKHDDASFITIEYNGRTYIWYGTTNNQIKYSYIDSCIGYLIQDENISSVTDLNNTNRRIYTLSGDPDHNFLMDYDNADHLMNQPSFFRATDTKDKEIDIPEYIESFEDEFWEE